MCVRTRYCWTVNPHNLLIVSMTAQMYRVRFSFVRLCMQLLGMGTLWTRFKFLFITFIFVQSLREIWLTMYVSISRSIYKLTVFNLLMHALKWVYFWLWCLLKSWCLRSIGHFKLFEMKRHTTPTEKYFSFNKLFWFSFTQKYMKIISGLWNNKKLTICLVILWVVCGYSCLYLV